MKRLLLIISFFCIGKLFSNEAEQVPGNQNKRTYTLHFKGGQLKVDQRFMNSFSMLKGFLEVFEYENIKDGISLTLFDDLDHNVMQKIQALFETDYQDEALNIFKAETLEDQAEILNALDILGLQNENVNEQHPIFGKFEDGAKNKFIEKIIEKLLTSYKNDKNNKIIQMYQDLKYKSPFLFLSGHSWNVEDVTKLETIKLPFEKREKNQHNDQDNGFFPIAATKDGKTLFVGVDSRVIVYSKNNNGEFFERQILGTDVFALKKILSISKFDSLGHFDDVSAITLSDDENYLFTASQDKTIIVWKKDNLGIWHFEQKVTTDNQNVELNLLNLFILFQ